MKRSKQMEQLIADVNTYLQWNRVTDKNDPAFAVVTNSLLQHEMYKGYTLCTEKEIGGIKYVVSAGKDGQFLQIL